MTNYTQQEKTRLENENTFAKNEKEIIAIIQHKGSFPTELAKMIYSFCKEHYIFQKVSINLYTNNPKSIIYFINETKSNIELKKEVNNDNKHERTFKFSYNYTAYENTSLGLWEGKNTNNYFSVRRVINLSPMPWYENILKNDEKQYPKDLTCTISFNNRHNLTMKVSSQWKCGDLLHFISKKTTITDSHTGLQPNITTELRLFNQTQQKHLHNYQTLKKKNLQNHDIINVRTRRVS